MSNIEQTIENIKSILYGVNPELCTKDELVQLIRNINRFLTTEKENCWQEEKVKLEKVRLINLVEKYRKDI